MYIDTVDVNKTAVLISVRSRCMAPVSVLELDLLKCI